MAMWLPLLILEAFSHLMDIMRAITGVNGSVQPEMMIYDITEWLARQPWSNGTLVCGVVQLLAVVVQAATTAPPHLKAIFPMSFEFDV